jgi:hypothetical protein
MIIGLHGFAQSGKDSLAKIMVEDFGYTRIAFADILREAVYRLNPIVEANIDVERGVVVTRVQPLIDSIGWERAKVEYEEIRRLLQVMGTEVGRQLFYEDIWVDAALKDYDPQGKYVVTDMRFDNEVAAIEGRKGVLVKVKRPGVGPVNDHVSDRGLPDEVFDLILDNDSTLEAWEDKAVMLTKWSADFVARRALFADAPPAYAKFASQSVSG